jgi:SAM-dependent methyltransferase
VLTLGCGTGRVALPLAAAGIPTVGVDWDAGMLAFLQRRLGSHSGGLPLRLVQADFRALPFRAATFPLAVLPCNTYTTVPPHERRAFLQGVAQVLQPGGLFAFSAPNPLLVASLPAVEEAEPETAFRHPENGLPVQVSSGWRRTEDRWTVLWHYDTLHPDGAVSRQTVSQTHWLASPASELARLEAAGLHPLAQYGGFDGAPLAPDAPYWVVVARRL